MRDQRNPSMTLDIGFTRVDVPPPSFHERARVDDRARVEPDLDEETEGLAEIPVLHVEGGKPEAGTEDDREPAEDPQRQKSELWPRATP
jgi:hypothetical protein